jgi:hypothetical protein
VVLLQFVMIVVVFSVTVAPLDTAIPPPPSGDVHPVAYSSWADTVEESVTMRPPPIPNGKVLQFTRLRRPTNVDEKSESHTPPPSDPLEHDVTSTTSWTM